MSLRFVILSTALILSILVQWAAPRIKKNKTFVAPPQQIKHFTLGYSDFVSASLWLRLMQDIDYCENGRFQEKDFVVPLPIEDKIEGVLARGVNPPKCHLGWVYQMLDSITELTPTYKTAYDIGSTFLSVAVDDREGARRIFEKGLSRYPEDWELNFRAGYHYLWEIRDSKRSAELFQKAAQNGAPPWAAALSAGLYTRNGQAQIAKVILEDALRRKPTGFGVDRLKIRLDQANKILTEK